jgi:preprotein translocase subunit SecA
MLVMGIDPQMDAAFFKEAKMDEVIEKYQDQIREFYEREESDIIEVMMPFINDVYTNEGHRYKRIAIPYTDGRTNPLHISANLEAAVKTKGASIMRDIEKAVALAVVDEKWKEHLRSMDELKESVQAASFEQKDPLVVYKMEAFGLFEQLVYAINEEVTSYLFKGTVIFQDGTTLKEAKQRRTDFSRVQESRQQETQQAAKAAAEGVSRVPKPETFKRVDKKVGRNDPCPCGSGKKYKHCHGK